MLNCRLPHPASVRLPEAVFERTEAMTDKHQKYEGTHSHIHGPNCGHTAVKHDGHTDYLQDGHLHHAYGEHVDHHEIGVTAANPDKCTPEHNCASHEKTHTHGAHCGHEAVPHGNHIDYLVDGHLHHPHHNHCDDHGELEVVTHATSPSTQRGRSSAKSQA